MEETHVWGNASLRSSSLAVSYWHVYILQKTFRTDGLEAVRRGEDSRAIELLQLSLKHDGATVDEQREMLQLLCELYFKQKSFNDCLCTGRKLKDTYKGEKNEVIILIGFWSVRSV